MFGCWMAGCQSRIPVSCIFLRDAVSGVLRLKCGRRREGKMLEIKCGKRGGRERR